MADDIMIKLGLDATALGKGITEAKGRLQELSEKGKSGFISAGSSARMFKKTLEEISEQSPILGTALKMAINPIIGTLAAATAAFAYFSNKLKEWNAEMDKQQALNAQAIVGADKLREVRAKQFELEQDYQKFAKALNDADTDAKRKAALEGQLAALKDIVALEAERVKISKALGEKQIEDAVKSGRLTKEQGEAVKEQLGHGLDQAGKRTETAARAKEMEAYKKQQLEATQRQLAAQDEAARLKRELEGGELSDVRKRPSAITPPVTRKTGIVGYQQGFGGSIPITGYTETEAEFKDRQEAQKKRLEEQDKQFDADRAMKRKQLQDRLSEQQKISSGAQSEAAGAGAKWDAAMRQLNLQNAKDALSKKPAAVAPTIGYDEEGFTTGYVYKGLENKGGIKYNNRLLHKPAKTAATAATPQDMLAELLKLAQSTGLKVTIEDVKDF